MYLFTTSEEWVSGLQYTPFSFCLELYNCLITDFGSFMLQSPSLLLMVQIMP